MNEMCTNLIRGMSQQSVQIVVVFLIVAGATWLLRHRSAHWRYMLWLVVVIKCVTPPAVSIPLAILPVKTTPSSGIIEPATANRIAPVSPIAYKWATGGPSVENKGTQHPGSAASPKKASMEPVAPVAATEFAAPLPADPSSTVFENNPAWRPSHWVALAWFVGVVIFGVGVLGRGWRICSHLRRSRHPVADSLQREISAIAQTMGLKRSPTAWLTEGYAQPFVLGLWRGSLYLPADFGELTLDARRQILAHELAHIVRCDAAINTLQIIAQGLFFFHPLVWWANRQLRREREKCCDEIAIATRIVQPRQYTTAIVDALLRDRGPKRAMSTLAVAGPVKNLEERIKTILTPGKKFFRRPTWSAIVTVLLLAAVVAPTALTLTARAEENTPAKATNAKTPENADQEKQEKTDSTNPIVTLPNGVTVELIAISSHPSKPDGWWKPNGEVITDQTFKTQGGNIGKSNDKNAYELIFKLDASDKTDITTSFQRENGLWLPCQRKSPDHRDYKVCVVHFPNNQTSCSLRIGVAAGEWKMEKIFPSTPLGNYSYGSVNYPGFAYSGMIQSGTDLVVTISENLRENLDRRIIVLDKNGNLHSAERIDTMPVGHAHQSTATFANLKQEDVKEFQFQTRPYEWVLFKNISLQPGKKQDVTACQTEEGNFQPQTKTPATGSPASVEATPSTEEEVSIRTMLQKRIPKIELTDVRFADAMEYMKEVSGLNIFVNFGQINQQYNAPSQSDARIGEGGPPGMMPYGPAPTRRTLWRGARTTTGTKKQYESRDVQVSVALKDVTVEDALRRVLDSAAGAMGLQLGYTIDGSMVVVSTAQGLQEMTPRHADVSSRRMSNSRAARAGLTMLPPETPTPLSEEEKMVLNKLKKRIPKIELRDVRFSDSIQYLREVSSLNVFVNWGQIDKQIEFFHKGTSRYSVNTKDIQIQLDLEDVSVEDVLRRLLDTAGGEMGIPLGYTIDGSVVVISSLQGISELTPRLSSKEIAEPVAPNNKTPGPGLIMPGYMAQFPKTRSFVVYAPFEGVLVETCRKTNGQKVSKGEVLMRLDTSEIDLEHRRRDVKKDFTAKKYDRLRSALKKATKEKKETSSIEAEIEAVRAEYILAELDVKEMEMKFKKSTITAPADGTVSQFANIPDGSTVKAGQMIMQIQLPEEEPEKTLEIKNKKSDK